MKGSKLSVQRVVHAFGVLLVVISLGFIVTLLWSQRHAVLAWRPDISAIIVLFLCIIGYAAAGILLARAWRQLLLWSGEVGVDVGDACLIYGRSQIAKYIPGNVAQLVGRHVIGRQYGWSHTGLLIASVLELVSLVIITSIIGIIGLSLAGIVSDKLSLPLLIGLASSLIVAIMLVFHLGPRVVEIRWPEIAKRLSDCRTTGLWRTGLFHLVFFMVNGLIFILMGDFVFENFIPPTQWPGIIGLVALAWVAGIITPGAPSGIGIRESVLALGLAGIAPMGEVLLLVGLFRLVTVTGDIVFFLAVTWYSRS